MRIFSGSYTSATGGVLWLHGRVIPGMQPNKDKDTDKEAPQWTFNKNRIPTIGNTDATERTKNCG